MSNGNLPPKGAMSSPFGKGQFAEALGTAGFTTVGTQQNFLPPFNQQEADVIIEAIKAAGGEVISTSEDMLVLGLKGIAFKVLKVQ